MTLAGAEALNPNKLKKIKKSTVRNYGTIYFPRYGTVRKYDILFVLFSNLFRTNLIIERRPLRYVRNQDLYRFRRVSMK